MNFNMRPNDVGSYYHSEPPPPGWDPSMVQSAPLPHYYYTPNVQPFNGDRFTRGSSKRPFESRAPQPKKPKETFFCDACERDFQQHSQFQEHIKSHVQCSAPGCAFSASKVVVQEHVERLHSVNRKPVVLESPEELSAYIQERKKKYPTDTNIAKKQEEEDAKRSQGGIMDRKSLFNQRGGHRGRGGSLQSRGRGRGATFMGRGNGRGFHRSPSSMGRKNENSNLDVSTEATVTNNKTDTRVQSTMEVESSNKETVARDGSSNLSTDKVASEQSALSALLSNYDSDDGAAEHGEVREPKEFVQVSSEQENLKIRDKAGPSNNVIAEKDAAAANCTLEQQQPISSNHSQPLGQPRKRACQYFARGYCRHGDSCRFAHESPSENVEQQEKDLSQRPEARTKVPSRPSTLLQKLLAKEIRQEKNYILQCFRHLVLKSLV